MQRGDQRPVYLVTNEIDQFRLDDPLPNIQEAVDNFIVWLGNAQGPVIGRHVHLDVHSVSSWIGLSLEDVSGKFFGWLLQDCDVSTLVEHDASLNGLSAEPEILVANVRLTIAGWARFEVLK